MVCDTGDGNIFCDATGGSATCDDGDGNVYAVSTCGFSGARDALRPV
ncbi:MAG: hypothetical protein AAGF81_09785 [Pseudomonadota bacterium]